MHDTPHKGLFIEDARFDSSGCVRVQNIRELIVWLLRDTSGWTRDKVFAKLNDEITVKGWQAKDGTNHLYGDMLTFSDGSMMQLGSGLGVV